MIKFKLNGKKISIPSSWDDLSFNQYYDIINSDGDLLKRVCLLHRIDYEVAKKATIIGLEEVFMALRFLNTPPQFPGVVPQVGKYKLPLNVKGQFDIRFESLGQFEDLRQVIERIPTENDKYTITGLMEAYPKMVAIYLQKIRDAEYNPAKADDMVEDVKAMPAKEVIVTGSFFLIKLRSLLNGTPTTSLPTPPTRKKSKPGFKTLVRSSGNTRSSLKSRRK